MPGTFYYFGFGSNLLSRRILINNPSAIRIGKGKLQNHRLDFITYSKRWKGASATIVPHSGHYVWGAIWEINLEDLPHLDWQEGVHANIYRPYEVVVEEPDLSTRKCRAYIQTAIPEYIENIEELSSERQPSGVYLATIIQGAIESALPDKYIKFLKRIPHNKHYGDEDLRLALNIVE